MFRCTSGSLTPTPELHSASMSVQQSTSIPTQVQPSASIHRSNVYRSSPLQLQMRMQVSLQVSPNPGLGGFFTHLTPVILPVFWFEAEASITEDMAQKLRVLGESRELHPIQPYYICNAYNFFRLDATCCRHHWNDVSCVWIFLVDNFHGTILHNWQHWRLLVRESY